MRNREEISADGTTLKTPLELKGQFVPLVSTQTKCVFQIADGITLEVPNRGIRMFSKRAILRVGMLLHDSKIAQEVRAQFLVGGERPIDRVRNDEWADVVSVAAALCEEAGIEIASVVNEVNAANIKSEERI